MTTQNSEQAQEMYITPRASVFKMVTNRSILQISGGNDEQKLIDDGEIDLTE